MRIVSIIVGILGSGALFVAGILALILGAAGSGLGSLADDAQIIEEAGMIGARGVFAILISIIALVGACLSLAKPKVAAIIMLIAALSGLIAVGWAAILGGILLIIGAIFAFLGRKEGRVS